MHRRARKTFYPIHTRPPTNATQSRRRVDCGSSTLALSHRGRHKRQGRCARSHVPPRSITRSDAHAARRHPHPCHRQHDCANTRRVYMHACNFLHRAIRASPCISIVTRVPRTRHHHGRAHPRPPLSRRVDPLPSARQDIHGAHSTPHRNLPRTQENRARHGAARTRTFTAPAPDGAVVARPIPEKLSGERLLGA
jgi:hypothetical protein